MFGLFTARARGVNKLLVVTFAACGFALASVAVPASATVSFDPSFGSGGTAFSSSLSQVNGAALDPDGRIVVAGSVTNMPMAFSVARFSANGSPDVSFGSGGLVADAMPGSIPAGFFQGIAADVAVQPDHKVVIVGAFQTGSVGSSLAVVRLNEDGTADTDFGDGGRVLIPAQDSASARAVEIAPNGDIIVGGDSYDNSPYYAPNVIAVRLDDEGQPVETFGTGGVASTDMTANQMIFVSDVLSDGDGVIVVAGVSSQISLTRFKSDGDLDGSYGTGGVAKAAFPENSNSGRAKRLPGGKVIVAGGSGVGFALAQFTSTGQLDPSFGFGGMLTAGFTGESFASDVAVRGNGKVIAAGYSGQLSGGAVTFAALGATPSGARDDSFGSAGRLTTQLPLTSRSGAKNAFIDPQGRLLVVGWAGYGAIGMVRYTVDDLIPEGSPGPTVSLDADFPSSVKSSKFRRLAGVVTGSAARVQVAIRQDLSSESKRRCRWLYSAKVKFGKVKQRGSCDRKTWLGTKLDAEGKWKLSFSHRLPIGRYTVFVRALDADGAAAAQLKSRFRVR